MTEEDEEYSLNYEHDGKTISCFPITFGLANHIFTYNVMDGEEAVIDTGFIIIGTKVCPVEEDETEPRLWFYVRLVESTNMYLENLEYLYETVEEAIASLVPDLVVSSGSSSYLSQFL